MNRSDSGLTLVEVLVAVFILGLSSSVVMRLVRDADVFRGRSYQVATAARLAENEAERVRQIARMRYVLEDSLYNETVDRLELEVRRSVLREDTYDELLDTLAAATVQIDVRVPGREKNLVSMRLIQGYGE
jgi:prepilin-type N-terminal cleavage/methylation domain-containing protein